MTDSTVLYDEDFVAWSRQQAEALRAAAKTGSNLRLDWENLAEEIEDLGKSTRRELGSRLSVILEHLMKLELSRAKNPRASWRQTIRRERAAIERLLDDSPSLRRELPDLAQKERRRIAGVVIADLNARRELTAPSPDAPHAAAEGDIGSYTAEQILEDWFPPDPKASPREK
jgi:hypothetical protein